MRATKMRVRRRCTKGNNKKLQGSPHHYNYGLSYLPG